MAEKTPNNMEKSRWLAAVLCVALDGFIEGEHAV
jgi:hypothetical protein